MFEKQTKKGQTKVLSNSNSRAKQSKNDQSQQDNSSKSQTNSHHNQSNGPKISLKNHILKKISNNKDNNYFQGQTHSQKSVSGDGNQLSTDGYQFSKDESQSRMKFSRDQEAYYGGLSQTDPRHVQYNMENVVTDKKKGQNRPPVNSYYQTIKAKSISQNTQAKNPYITQTKNLHYTQASTYPYLQSNPSSIINSSHTTKYVTSFDYMHSTPSASVKNQNLPPSRMTSNETNSQQNVGYRRKDYKQQKFLYLKNNFNNQQQQVRRVDTNEEEEEYRPGHDYKKDSLNSQSMKGEQLNHRWVGKNTNSTSFYINNSSKNNIAHLQSYNSCEQYSQQSHPSTNYNKNYQNSYFSHEHHYNNTNVNITPSSHQPVNFNQQPYLHPSLNYDKPRTFFKTNQNNTNNFINNVRFFNDSSTLPVKHFVTCHGAQLEKSTYHHNQETPKLNTLYQSDKTQPDSILFPSPIPNNHNTLNVNNGQSNSKSSLTVRNPDRNTTEIRNKSHTKNYSNAQILQTHQFLPYTPNTHNFNSYPSQDQTHHSKTTHIAQPTHSNNAYKYNLTPTINNPTEKTSALCEISEKDEFGKAFFRSNQKNEQKADSVRNIKHIQRHQDSNKSGKQKISVISENIMIKQFDAKLTSNSESVSNLTNLKYIKSPTNTDIESQSKNVNKDKMRTGDRYLKVSYNPLLSRQKSREQVGKQHDKSQTHSVNSSFKENKSETKSAYNSGKGNIARGGQKPSSQHEYKQGDRYKQNDTKIKYNNPKINAIEISNSNANLHKNQKQYSSNQLYRKTIAFNQLSHDLHDIYGQNKQHTQSVGFQQNRTALYDSHDATRGYFKTTGDMTFTSPDLKQFVCTINEATNHSVTMQMSLPQYSTHNGSPQHQKHTKKIQGSGQKLTLFSPKQKDLQPVQKNHFLGDTQSQNYRQSVRQKKSIKKMLVSQSKGLHTKPQVLVSLNFKDLLRGQADDSRPNSRKLIEVITKNHFTKIFCSTFKIGENQNGCDCIPKCFWVQRWIEIINRTPLVQKNSMMHKLDKNVIANLNGESLWMNFTKEEVVSFADIDTSSLNKDEIETFKQIDKDIPRTFSSHPTFKNQRYRQFLRQLLIHSYYLDPHLGYVQGMNIIGASIVYHSKTVYQSLQLMDFVMNVLDYKKIFLNQMRKCRQLAIKTTHIIRINCYDLYMHVTVDNQVDLEMFILGWYLSMLGTFVPLQAMHFVINKFIQKQFGGIMKIIVTYFIFIKDILMEKNDPNQIMQELSVQAMSERSAKIDWNQLITVSDKLKLSLDKNDL